MAPYHKIKVTKGQACYGCDTVVILIKLQCSVNNKDHAASSV